MKRFWFKSFMAGIIFCAVIFSCFGVYAESVTKTIEVIYENIKMKVEGKDVSLSAEPFTYDGEVYIPATALNGIAGYELKRDGDASVLSVFKKTPDVALTDERSIEDYLIENYSLVRTSKGTCRLEFTVSERFSASAAFDFYISATMESAFYYDNISSALSILTAKELELVKEEVKAEMEVIACDVIKKLPGKILRGCYSQSYYKNPKTKNIKGFVSVTLMNWANYNYSAGDKYDDIKPLDTLVWLPFADTK